MNDQANDLRRLARSASAAPSGVDRVRPRMVVVAGGKGGVGTSTLAVNLAVTMAEQGCRTVIVDADPQGADVAWLCSVADGCPIDEVMCGHQTVAEAIRPGLAGLDVLCGPRGGGIESGATGHERLIVELESLPCEAIVIDTGNDGGRLARRLWQAADRVLVVVTPDVASIMNGYARIKVLADGCAGGSIGVVVNRVPRAGVAKSVFGRLAEACGRFLGIKVDWAGWLPDDAEVGRAGNSGESFVLAAPACAAARHVRQLADGEARTAREGVQWELSRRARTRTSTTVA